MVFDFDWAVETAAKKKKLDCSMAEFLTIDEGLCVQIMRLGHLTMNRQRWPLWIRMQQKTVGKEVPYVKRISFPIPPEFPLHCTGRDYGAGDFRK